mmetsp:Transcript_13978/g.25460  ORF Transcript_13978/g.25460 Transcript_13978/m.25460 type:complete len:201 (-) Transcript_13978:97-699(-)
MSSSSTPWDPAKRFVYCWVPSRRGPIQGIALEVRWILPRCPVVVQRRGVLREEGLRSPCMAMCNHRVGIIHMEDLPLQRPIPMEEEEEERTTIMDMASPTTMEAVPLPPPSSACPPPPASPSPPFPVLTCTPTAGSSARRSRPNLAFVRGAMPRAREASLASSFWIRVGRTSNAPFSRRRSINSTPFWRRDMCTPFRAGD